MVTVGPPDSHDHRRFNQTHRIQKPIADFVFQVRPIGTFSGSVQVSILPPNTGTAWPAGTYAPSSGSFNGAFGDLSAGEHLTIPERYVLG